MPTLKEDVFSHFLKNKQVFKYGSKGEKVKIIADRGTVVIAESKNGRFPCLKEKLA